MSCILSPTSDRLFSYHICICIFVQNSILPKHVFNDWTAANLGFGCTIFAICYYCFPGFGDLLFSSTSENLTLLDLIHIHRNDFLAFRTSQRPFRFISLTFCVAGLKSTASVGVTRVVVPSFASMGRVRKRRSKGRR